MGVEAMTREEAADILIESYDGKASEMRARRADKRRQALIDGDPQMLRAMPLTASPKTETTPDELEEAVRVLSRPPDSPEHQPQRHSAN
jgi:hypothetical protein